MLMTSPCNIASPGFKVRGLLFDFLSPVSILVKTLPTADTTSGSWYIRSGRGRCARCQDSMPETHLIDC